MEKLLSLDDFKPKIVKIIINQNFFIMKKVYALGVALAVAATSMAAPKTAPKVETMSQMNLDAPRVEVPAKKKSEAPAKAVSSVDDLCGLFKFSAYGWLGGEGNPKYGPQAGAGIITKKDANTIILSGFPMGDVPVAINFAAKTFTILNKQVVGQNGPDEDVYLYTYEMTETADGKMTRKSVSSIRGTISDDGILVFSPSSALGWSDPQNEAGGSFYYLNNKYVLERTDFYTPKAEDYEFAGNGDYFDGFFNPLYLLSNEPEVEPYEVNIYKNKTNPNLLAVKDPYMTNEVWSTTFNDLYPVEGGWFLFDIVEPACVQMVPLVECGMIDEAEDGSTSRYFPFNQEGYNTYMNGMLVEDVLFQYEIAFDDCSSMSEDGEGNYVMDLIHLFFGVEEAPTGEYWWTKDTNDRLATLTFPVDIVGIKGINADATDGVKKFYNLQGVEIANPVKGQLVIVKDGNKAVKQIVK